MGESRGIIFLREASIEKVFLEFYRKMTILQAYLCLIRKNMAKLKIQTGNDNPILRSVSESIKLHELKKYKNLADDMLRHIKNPENGGI